MSAAFDYPFSSRTISSLGFVSGLASVGSIFLQIVLYHKATHSSGTSNDAVLWSVSLQSGVWSGVIGLLALIMTLLAYKMPTGRTLFASIAGSIIAVGVSLAHLALVSYGLAENGDFNDDDEEKFVSSLIGIRPAVVAHNEEVQQTASSMFAFGFSTQLLLAAAQIISSLAFAIMSMKARKCGGCCNRNRKISSLFDGSIAKDEAFGTVLFSARSEGDQRRGFINIPVHAGLYQVTGNTLKRDRKCGAKLPSEPPNYVDATAFHM